MIHLFFTKLEIDNLTFQLDPFSVLENEDLTFSTKKITQVYFNEMDQLKINFGPLQNNNNFLGFKDSALLIHDDKIINKEGFVGSNPIFKNKILELICTHDECAIYFHKNGFNRHELFLDWIKQDVVSDVKFHFSKKGSDEVLKHSHIENSVFHELIKILLSADSEDVFSEALVALKNKIYGTDQQNEELEREKLRTELFTDVLSYIYSEDKNVKLNYPIDSPKRKLLKQYQFDDDNNLIISNNDGATNNERLGILKERIGL